MNEVMLNGKIMPANEPALFITNRAFRYGDALFETMRIKNGRILLEQFHFERLFEGLILLKIDAPGFFIREKISSEIIKLCSQNNCEALARVRLTVFRSPDPGNALEYLIECWPLNEQINDRSDIVIDIFPDVRKSCDKFSNLKSANYLPYIMAGIYAKENQLNDCLLLNVHERICDASIANVFWIKDGMVFTPPLSEGGIAGVMRRFLLESLQSTIYKVQEKSCSINELESADEVFLTNAIKGIRCVRQFRNKYYSDMITSKIQNDHLDPIMG